MRAGTTSTAVVAALLTVGASPGAPQAPQFRAAVDTVRVDVVVTDPDGTFVDDLGAGDFALFEDGVRQRLVGVELVDLGAGEVRRVTDEASAEPTVPGAARPASDRRADATSSDAAAGVTASDVADGATPSDAGAGATGPSSDASERADELGAVIFLLDLPGLYFQNQIRFAESMDRVFDRIEALTLPHAVYMVDLAGKLRELQPLTTDADALVRAAGEARTTLASQSRSRLLKWLDVDAGWRTRIARYEQRRRSLATYDLLTGFVDALAHRRGRTALVWVSTGVDLATYDTVERSVEVTGDPRDTEGFRSYSPDPTIRGLQEELHRAANTANVSIYSVDPSALWEFYVEEDNASMVDRHGSTADARGNSLRHAAEATGGEAFIAWTDLERVLENVERDTGRFYLLSYAPEAHPAAGEYHEIRVEVDRPRTTVRARLGYVHHGEQERRGRILRAALSLPGTASDLDVSVVATRAREGDGQALVIVDAAVSLTPEGPPDDAAPGRRSVGSPQAGGPGPDPPLLVYATVRDGDGNLVASVEEERLTPAPGPGPAPPTDGDSPGARAAQADRGTALSDAGARVTNTVAPRWLHRAAHRLEPGIYDVRVAVIDAVSERVGAARLEVEIADAAGEWDVSDPWLAVQSADGSLAPVVDGQVAAGRRIFAYVEVYEGVSPAMSGWVSPSSLNSDAAERRNGGPSMPLPEADGVHRGNVPLTSLPPGHYVLTLRVDDPGAGRDRTVQLALEVRELR